MGKWQFYDFRRVEKKAFYDYRRMPRLSPTNTLFGRRLREARIRAGIAQDRLGVMIGMDEGSSSARMSRYETGTHEPPFSLAEKLANVLKVPAAYFYCDDDQLAVLLIRYSVLGSSAKEQVQTLVANLSATVT